MYIEITNFTNCKKYIRTFLHFHSLPRTFSERGQHLSMFQVGRSHLTIVIFVFTQKSQPLLVNIVNMCINSRAHRMFDFSSCVKTFQLSHIFSI